MLLVASRALYDLGAAMAEVPALAGLVQPQALRVNPHDLDDLGVAAGGSVRLRTGAASLVVEVVPDPSLPRKVVSADFNVPLTEGTIADLIDTGAPRVEYGWRRHEHAGRPAPLFAAGDPLYMNGVGWAVFLIVIIKVLVIFGFLMVSVMLMIWFERKSSRTCRVGSGPTGLVPSASPRPWPTGSSCSSRKT